MVSRYALILSSGKDNELEEMAPGAVKRKTRQVQRVQLQVHLVYVDFEGGLLRDALMNAKQRHLDKRLMTDISRKELLCQMSSVPSTLRIHLNGVTTRMYAAWRYIRDKGDAVRKPRHSTMSLQLQTCL